MYYRFTHYLLSRFFLQKKEQLNIRHTVHVPTDNRTSAYCSTIQTVAFTTRTLKSSVSISASCSTFVAINLIWPGDRTNASRFLEAAFIHVWNWKFSYYCSTYIIPMSQYHYIITIKSVKTSKCQITRQQIASAIHYK